MLLRFVGGIEYKNSVLEAIYHSEGRLYKASPTVGAWQYEYSLKDHLGNTRVTFADADNNGTISTSEILQENHYYPFGLNQEGNWYNNAALPDSKYQYNGKELNEDLGLNWNDYGARGYMADLGRWNAVDKMADKYASVSPYVYTLNRPTVAIDPDGKRVYFIGGAANDDVGWDYIGRWGKEFGRQGINFTRVNASHGKAGDVYFTSQYRNSAYEIFDVPVNNFYERKTIPVQEEVLDKTVKYYQQQLKDDPLKKDEQFNLAGYSYGSVLQAQSAIKLADSGQVIDNLILIGSPISDKSELWKQLKANENIKNVIRYDIKGDLLSNPQDVLSFIRGGKQNFSDAGPHFDAARPGAEADKLIRTITEWLKKQGVKN